MRKLARVKVELGLQKVRLGRGTWQELIPLEWEVSEPLLHMSAFLAGVSAFSADMRIERRRHGFHLFLMSLAGRGVVETPGGRRTIAPNECWLIPSRTHHCYYPADKEGWKILWFHFPEQLTLPEAVGRESRFLGAGSPRLEMLVEGFLEEMTKGRPDAIVSGRAYATLIAKDLRDLLDLAPSVGHRRKLEDLWAKVSRDLAHPWSTAQLAERLGVSATHLHRLMLQYYGRNQRVHLESCRSDWPSRHSGSSITRSGRPGRPGSCRWMAASSKFMAVLPICSPQFAMPEIRGS